MECIEPVKAETAFVSETVDTTVSVAEDNDTAPETD